ncbi:MAG: ATP-binding protein, partial [Desulfobacterales bacterium]|nr:ATP-binding protein [Desulfobacterales bacterium]
MGDHSDIDQNTIIRRILLVEDDRLLALPMSQTLVRAGYFCERCHGAEAAWHCLNASPSHGFDLVIGDGDLLEADGSWFLKQVKRVFHDLDFLAILGHSPRHTIPEIIDAGAADYLIHPFESHALLHRIHRISRDKFRFQQLQATHRDLHGEMSRVKEEVETIQAASQAKTFFLAAMSHEIRTPLNGIVGYTDMLMDTGLDSEQNRLLSNARLSCDSLLSVVNDILDFSKVEAGKMPMDSIAFDPEVLCFQTLDQIRSLVDEKQVELSCRISPAVPGKVKGDPHRMRQVLLNLLGNAVKFTHGGRICLELDASREQGGNIPMRVKVTDTGVGIAPEDLGGIFEPFVQSRQGHAVRPGQGTGLGLAISRNIARQMGGDLTVESQLGEGSCFIFSVLMEGGDGGANEPPLRPVGLKGKKALVYG